MAFVRIDSMLRTLILSIIIGITALLPFAMSAATATEVQTATLDVPGMTCNFCPITVRKALSQVAGVIEARSD